MAYRDDLDALEARKTALDAQLAATQRERDGVATLLDDARKRASLPILDNIRVAAPCPVGWDTMQGDDRVRHCARCDKRVYNLSAMTRDEATELLVATEGRMCARFFRRADGTIMTSDCEPGLRRRRRRLAVVVGGAAVLLGTGLVAYEAREQASSREVRGGEITGIVAPPTTGVLSAPPTAK